MIQYRTRVILACVVASITTTSARADPWLAPGDEGLRSDIQLLADAGILRGPVTTWPMSWPDIARDVIAAEGRGLDQATNHALARVRRLARQASDSGFAGLGIRVSGAYEPTTLREFADTPREEGELAMRASWLTEHFAVNLQGSYVVDPDDDKDWRADGSYLGVNFGNFMLSAGFMERWWGPGWDGSLILSTNARPIPTLTLERNYTDPFKTRWLSWLGPWRASIAMGEAEAHDVAVPNVKFFAARLNFKPRSWLEFGLTRTAQWCGGDRSCDWDTFVDMVLGNDNQVADGGGDEDQPGNQMAGYDMRLRSPWHALPLVFYTQWIGEDEAGGLPSKFIGQFGLETWGSAGMGGWRARFEYADTACNFSREEPEFGCAYRNAIYPQGYAYRGRIIGHSMDNDSRMYTLGGLLTRANGDVLSVTLRRVELNRDGGGHAISDVPVDLDNVELRYSRGLGAGKISAGIGYADSAIRPEASSLHGFVDWQQGF
ncbi:MAG TPA: capsule assembly Wzi family protein [Steroidobacteraceae bacterium]|nr:capsule assembly Wzi family protein [Steroidobacteraceae bacterium]